MKEKVMLMARYKTIIVVLLTLFFTGQVLASAKLSCPSQSSEQTISSDMMDHSQHLKMDSSSADTMAGAECCPNCDCNLGGCTATAVLPTAQSLFVTGVVSLTNHHNELAANQLAVSLFRPPISR
jgi:hypothetical protein